MSAGPELNNAAVLDWLEAVCLFLLAKQDNQLISISSTGRVLPSTPISGWTNS